MSLAKTHTGEALTDISANRTLIAKKFTTGEVMKPEVIHGLQTVEQVFNYYRPALNFRFGDPKGITWPEELKFSKLEDFALSSIIQQSDFLKRQVAKKQMCLKLAGRVKINQSLAQALTDVDKRRSFEKLIKTMMDDLRKSK